MTQFFRLPVLLAVITLTALEWCAAPAAMAQGAPDSAGSMRAYHAATGLLNRGLFELAAVEYRSFLDAHPGHLKTDEARYGLAVCLYRLGRYDAAAVELTLAADAAELPYGAEVGTMLGQCHLALEQPTRAIPPLERVLREHGEHDLADDAAGLLVEAAHGTGRHDEVIVIAGRLATQWPDSPRRERAELLAGLTEMALARDADAARRFTDMRRQWPTGSYADQTELLLAQCLDRTQSVPQALKQYQRVIDHGRDAFVGEALYGRSALLYRVGDRDASASHLDTLLERFPTHARAASGQLLRARILLDEQKWNEAERRLDDLLERTAGPVDEVTYWRAKCDLRAGNSREAADRLADAVGRFPDSRLAPEMQYDLGVALLRAEALDESLTALEQFRTRFPKHELAPESLHLVAALHQQSGDYDESRAACASFRQSYPEHERIPDVMFIDAESAFLAGDREEAIERLRAFLAHAPDAEQRDAATFHLALALHQLEQYGDAEPLLLQTVSGPLANDDSYAPALLALGDLYFQSDDWGRSAPMLQDYLDRSPDLDGSLDALLKLGLCHHRLRDAERAVDAYDQLLDLDDDSAVAVHARFERGQALLDLDRSADAAAAFRQVVDDDDSAFTTHALHHLGAIAFGDSAYADAATYYGRAAARDDDPRRAADALLQQGRALSANADHDEAADVFTALLDTYPESEVADAARGHLVIALARQDDFESSLDASDAVDMGELDPELRASVRYEQAWALRGLQRRDGAKDAYRQLLADPPASTLTYHARLELAELETQDKQYDAAAPLLRDVVNGENPEVPAALRAEALYRLGACEYERRQWTAAVAALETFLETEPEGDLAASAHLLCGESLFNEGQHQPAIDHLRAVAKFADDAETHGASLLRLGESHAALQQWPKSEKAFTAYLERYPQGPLWFQARFGHGWSLENQDRRADAIVAYRAVVATHRGPTAARAQFQIGECLYADRQLKQAVAELIKVDILYAYPEWSAAALYEAGRCFRELSDPVEARRHFEQVEKAYPETNWARLAGKQLEELRRIALPGHDDTTARGAAGSGS